MISLVAVFATLLIRSSLVRSQNTTATCVAGFEWVRILSSSSARPLICQLQTFNSLGQSPCLITAYLWEPCYALNRKQRSLQFRGPQTHSSRVRGHCGEVRRRIRISRARQSLQFQQVPLQYRVVLDASRLCRVPRTRARYLLVRPITQPHRCTSSTSRRWPQYRTNCSAVDEDAYVPNSV